MNDPAPDEDVIDAGGEIAVTAEADTAVAPDDTAVAPDDSGAAPADDSAVAPADAASEHRLDSRWVAYRRRAGWVWSAALAAALCGIAYIVGTEYGVRPWLLYGAPLLVSGIAAAVLQWWPGHAWRHAGYRLGRTGITIRSGLVWREVIDVPWSRVQHTDVSQGPLERTYGLATLSVFTAGMTHARVRLHGLGHERALEIRGKLMQAVDDDVV